ncbi:MAG: D-aminoacylase [Chloroflexi bacterium]|nr:D-aminoacylase [Chloroflexota bacterium]
MGRRFDLIIKGGEILDGTGAGPFRADIGIAGNRIVSTGNLGGDETEHIINAAGLSVCPGFIDMHGHSDISILADGRAYSLAAQGVTTQVIGCCGFSAAPLQGEYAREYLDEVLREYGLDLRWSSLPEYIRIVEKSGVSINLIPLIGQGNIRGSVMDYNAEPADPEKLRRMGALLVEALKQGGWGLSTGLIYSPGCFAKENEIAELSANLDGLAPFYASHLRSESDTLIEAVTEALNIGKKAGVRVEISHLKAAYSGNWGKVNTALKLLEEANAAGQEAGCDVYPYSASCTGLSSVMPEWFMEGGLEKFLTRLRDPSAREKAKSGMSHGFTRDWSKTMISSVLLEKNKFCEGMRVSEYARSVGKEPEDAVMDLLLEEECVVSAIYFSMCEEDVEAVIKHPLSVIGSDSEARCPEGVLGRGKPHPRTYGTFPRVIAKYVRERSALTLPEAVRKMTSMTAERLGLKDRGQIRENYMADIVVFSPGDIKDTADFIDPKRFPDGIKAVIVNGVPVVYENEHTGAMPGSVLKRNGR